MANFKTEISRRQEEFSIAWLYAIASVAGYCVQNIRVDNDSIDALIRQKGNGNVYPKLDHISVQLKCTYAKIPKKSKISFPLSIKNYEDLRGKRMIPRILIVLHVPPSIKKWLEHNGEYVTLRNCAYWTSLKGQPASKNKRSVTVPIPVKQELTVKELGKMMDLAAKGKGPEELLV